ncbi:hypothetical protein GPALN_003003 [Globodera pallida]|nr:hypothetical protein GPALN_003003 [Globodera pallida]
MSSETSCLKRKRVADEELVDDPKRMAIVRKRRLPAELIKKNPVLLYCSDQLKRILVEFGVFSETRKMVGGGTCAMHHLGAEISDELFGHELLQYLCYGQSGRSNVVISTPVLNATAIGKLCGRLFEFVVATPNTLSMKHRSCLGLILRHDLPCVMQQSARTMARRGLFPSVRSNDHFLKMGKVVKRQRKQTAPKKFVRPVNRGLEKWLMRKGGLRCVGDGSVGSTAALLPENLICAVQLQVQTTPAKEFRKVELKAHVHQLSDALQALKLTVDAMEED